MALVLMYEDDGLPANVTFASEGLAVQYLVTASKMLCIEQPDSVLRLVFDKQNS